MLAAVGGEGFANPLGLEPMAGACVLMVDGLGWDLLRDGRGHAPFLSGAIEGGRGRPLDAGFPATTATSLVSFGTGVPPGEHGVVGYTFAVPGQDRPMNALRWTLAGPGPQVDLRRDQPPERLQPHPTLFERAGAAGVRAAMAGHPDFARSGLTRAAFRPPEYLGLYSLGDLIASVGAFLDEGPTRLVYAYHSDLDMTGHVRGVRSEAWAEQLGVVDRLAEALARRLPSDRALIITGDHGMVDVPGPGKIEFTDRPSLTRGVRMLGGEPRARFVYAHEGAEEDVLGAWRERLGDRWWVASRDEAVAAGWFGRPVAEEHLARIGDVIVAAREPQGVFQREVEGILARMTGHHGSLTPAEEQVPMIEIRSG